MGNCVVHVLARRDIRSLRDVERRITVEVVRLPKDSLVEIDAIAME